MELRGCSRHGVEMVAGDYHRPTNTTPLSIFRGVTFCPCRGRRYEEEFFSFQVRLQAHAACERNRGEEGYL
jgi:hypothetical protein